MGFLETDSYLDQDLKTTSVLLFCITPIFFSVWIILWHERNAGWWNLMLFDVVCGYGECRCVQWHIPQELERWIVGNVLLLNKKCKKKSIVCYCRFFLYISPDLQNAHAAFQKLKRKASLNFLAFICDNKKLLFIYT